jgi:hypothetical protein
MVVNKFDPRSDWQKFDDPLDNTYQGFHLYINQYPLSRTGTAGLSWKDIMQAAQDKGITKIVNTEVGADFRDEARYFTKSRVDEFYYMLQWCADRGIGNTIWLREDIDNLYFYEAYGLQMPKL